MSKRDDIAGLSGNVFFSGLVSFFMDLSSEMVYPLVPIFLSSVLGVNKSVIGLIEGIAESTASLLRVLSGWLSDRMRKRKVLMIAGYSISTLSRPALALSAAWGHVLASRFIDRFGKGIRVAPRDAIIAESSLSRDLGRSFGFHRAMDTLGAVLGPAAAFLVLSVFTGNFRLVFWLSLLPGIIAVLIIIYFIREQKPSGTQSHSVETSALPRFAAKFDWRFKAFVAIATLFSVGNSSDVFLILRATDIGIQETQIPVLYLSFNLVYSIISLPAGIVADRIGKKRVILLGYVLFAFIYWGFAGASATSHIWGLFLLYGIFMGLTEGVQKAYLATVIPAQLKATGFGIYNTFVGLAVLPASIVGGYLWDTYGPHATFYYGMATGIASSFFLLTVFGLDRMKKRTPPVRG